MANERRLVIVTSLTYSPDEAHTAEPINNEPSMTVPDMAMSLQEIMERFTRGQAITSFEPQYYDEEIPDITTMDLAEIQDYRESLRDHISSLQEELSAVENYTPPTQPNPTETANAHGGVADHEQPQP